jgi:hypothetical protein
VFLDPHPQPERKLRRGARKVGMKFKRGGGEKPKNRNAACFLKPSQPMREAIAPIAVDGEPRLYIGEFCPRAQS